MGIIYQWHPASLAEEKLVYNETDVQSRTPWDMTCINMRQLTCTRADATARIADLLQEKELEAVE